MSSHEMRVAMGWELAKPRLKPGMGHKMALPPGMEIPDIRVQRKPPVPEAEISNQNMMRDLAAEGDALKLRVPIQLYVPGNDLRGPRYHELDSFRIKCRDLQAVEWVRLQLRTIAEAMDGVKLEVVDAMDARKI